MLINPSRHKLHGTFHLLHHFFFITSSVRKLRHAETQLQWDAAGALSAALSFLHRTDSDDFTFVVVSEFTYDSRGTVIWFLNEELPVAITSAFNRQQRQGGMGAPLLFQHLSRDNITDLVKRESLPAQSWEAQEEHPAALLVPTTLFTLKFG